MVRTELESLREAQKVVGVKQLRKALLQGRIRQIFLAQDADPALTEPIARLAEEQGAAVLRVRTMRELGQACGIAVGASAAGLLKSL